MVFTKKFWGEEQERKLLEVEDVSHLVKEFISKEDFQDLAEELKILKKEFATLNKRKAQKVSEEIKLFETELKNFKKTNLKEFEEIQRKSKETIAEIIKLKEESIKKLDSEILKKVPFQVKSEDLDTLKIIKDFHNRLTDSKGDDEIKLRQEMREVIPKLNFSKGAKFKILNGLEDKFQTIIRFRFIIDKLLSGFDISELQSDSEINKQTTLNPKGKQNKSEGDYYGD